MTRQKAIDIGLALVALAGALLLYVLLGGCAGRVGASTFSLLGAPAESVWWAEPSGRTRPYAITWASGVLNVWNYDTVIHVYGTPGTEVLPYDAGYRATLPFNWQMGDTIRGALTAFHSADDSVSTLGGSLVASVNANTMDGVLVTRLVRTHGEVDDTVRFELVKVP